MTRHPLHAVYSIGRQVSIETLEIGERRARPGSMEWYAESTGRRADRSISRPVHCGHRALQAHTRYGIAFVSGRSAGYKESDLRTNLPSGTKPLLFRCPS